MAEFYEDDGIEIDDASLLAAMTSNGKVLQSNEKNDATMMDMSSTLKCDDSGASGSMEEEFLGDFRTEVAEVSFSTLEFGPSRR